MSRYIALLRAINVGGHVVKMDVLAKHFQSLKLKQVETFIASGNVIFSSDATEQELVPRIEALLKKKLGYDVPTLLRTDVELSAVARYQSFTAGEVEAAHALYVGFFAEPLARDAVKALRGKSDEGDLFHARGRELYWLRAETMAESKFTSAAFEKALGATTTFRNITTVQKLAAKYPATGP